MASTAQLLYGFGCNIVESDQFTDTSLDREMFFQRIRFDYSGLHIGLGNRPILERAIEELASRCGAAPPPPSGSRPVVPGPKGLRIACCSSARSDTSATGPSEAAAPCRE